jgi:hypothetical protein
MLREYKVALLGSGSSGKRELAVGLQIFLFVIVLVTICAGDIRRKGLKMISLLLTDSTTLILKIRTVTRNTDYY